MEIAKLNNRIDTLFQTKDGNILSIYFTAGYPHLDSVDEIVLSLEKAGADMIEIGIPFSDPVADGETIQRSNEIALENGMTVKLLLKQLRKLRQKTEIPIVIMTYLNPVFIYGMENFCKECNQIGIDGFIIPDLPLYEVESRYGAIFEKNNLRFIMLITPQTSYDRIITVDELSSGFVYAVSSASTTGSNISDVEDRNIYFQKISGMNIKNPILIGFGIGDHTSFSNACQHAAGAIIGSAFIKALNPDDLSGSITKFIKGIRK